MSVVSDLVTGSWEIQNPGCWCCCYMQFFLRIFQTLRQVSQRAISSSSRQSVNNKILEKQKFFQEDNGIPLYLKGGISDNLFFRVTMLLSLFALWAEGSLQVASKWAVSTP
uniref:Cytochrome c oxidase subunit 7A2, mitochondrial n=1 Tax=Leptobrachium leishanense TaxID=445787 RepID=A0A8C5WLT7_9ANUR